MFVQKVNKITSLFVAMVNDFLPAAQVDIFDV